MSKLKILIYADAYQDRLSQSLSYINFAAKFGEPILVSAESDFEFWLQHADVLLLPGGADVDPERYGEKAGHMVRFTNPQYEALDLGLLTPWIATGKPIIGICRGLQTLNVACGGSLFQHIINHQLSEDDKRTKGLHAIYSDLENIVIGHEHSGPVTADFRLHYVNSRHHQAIKEMAEGFEMLAWSSVSSNCPSINRENRKYLDGRHKWLEITKDKNGNLRDVPLLVKEKSKDSKSPYFNQEVIYYALPEIIKHKSKPYIAFQYHPEDLNDELATALIDQTLSEYQNA